MPAWFYVLRLASGRLYLGSTTDLEGRCRDHIRGKGCRTTKEDCPVVLLYSEEHPTFSAARLREAQTKRWTRAKKEALVTGDLSRLHVLARCAPTLAPATPSQEGVSPSLTADLKRKPGYWLNRTRTR